MSLERGGERGGEGGNKIIINEDDINEERKRERHTERRRPKIDPKYKIDP